MEAEGKESAGKAPADDAAVSRGVGERVSIPVTLRSSSSPPCRLPSPPLLRGVRSSDCSVNMGKVAEDNDAEVDTSDEEEKPPSSPCSLDESGVDGDTARGGGVVEAALSGCCLELGDCCRAPDDDAAKVAAVCVFLRRCASA